MCCLSWEVMRCCFRTAGLPLVCVGSEDVESALRDVWLCLPLDHKELMKEGQLTPDVTSLGATHLEFAFLDFRRVHLP